MLILLLLLLVTLDYVHRGFSEVFISRFAYALMDKRKMNEFVNIVFVLNYCHIQYYCLHFGVFN